MKCAIKLDPPEMERGTFLTPGEWRGKNNKNLRCLITEGSPDPRLKENATSPGDPCQAWEHQLPIRGHCSHDQHPS